MTLGTFFDNLGLFYALLGAALVVLAMTFAKVVFPVPGGPYKIMELNLSALIAR